MNNFKDINQIKDWWFNLSLREKATVSIGLTALLLLLFYWLIWSPLINTNEQLRDHISQNQKLLAWMQDADKTIQSLQKNFQPKNLQEKNSLPSIIQQELQQTSFASKATQLKLSDDGVQVSLQNVNFDEFSRWLIHLWQTKSIQVKHITVASTPVAGVVNVDCILG